MIIHFDSGKQRNYFFLIFAGWILLGWFYKLIFNSYEEEINIVFAVVLTIWIFIGKYILRYLFKIR